MKFQTKARTLQMLQRKLCCAKILPIIIFTIDDWVCRKSSVIKNITTVLGAGPWIVRSSFSGEDNLETSNAGAFSSVLNVNEEKLEEAVNTVIKSYCNDSLTEEVFVQPMLQNVEIAGVAFRMILTLEPQIE